jgi:hypothetical protein
MTISHQEFQQSTPVESLANNSPSLTLVSCLRCHADLLYLNQIEFIKTHILTLWAGPQHQPAFKPSRNTPFITRAQYNYRDLSFLTFLKQLMYTLQLTNFRLNSTCTTIDFDS